MNTLLEPEVKTYLGAIIRLIDHATEMYPHFESNRGQTDIADAREALNRLCSEYELGLCKAELTRLDRVIADCARRARQD